MGNATRTAFTTTDYRNALAGKGPLALEWADKPHRLIYDLCKSVEWWEAQSLARESEHTTLVTPEWLDGAEAKRLGFELDVCEWTTPASDPDGNDLDVVGIGIREDARPSYMRLVASSGEVWYVTVNAVPTIAQVRAAVFLATGRM